MRSGRDSLRVAPWYQAYYPGAFCPHCTSPLGTIHFPVFLSGPGPAPHFVQGTSLVSFRCRAHLPETSGEFWSWACFQGRGCQCWLSGQPKKPEVCAEENLEPRGQAPTTCVELRCSESPLPGLLQFLSVEGGKLWGSPSLGP